MTSIWSFGADSPMKFQIDDKLAENYNKALEKFLTAQRRFTQKFGKQWNGENLKIGWTRKEHKAWNEFADIYNEVNAMVGPFHSNELYDDFLVKNVSGIAAAASDKFGRVITTLAMGGALYGLLKGLQKPF